MHPWSSEESIIGRIHIYDQEFFEVLHLTEIGLDSDLPKRLLFALIVTLYDQAGMFEMVDD